MEMHHDDMELLCGRFIKPNPQMKKNSWESDKASKCHVSPRREKKHPAFRDGQWINFMGWFNLSHGVGCTHGISGPKFKGYKPFKALWKVPGGVLQREDRWGNLF